MVEKVHIFIATTQGLVAIRGIQHRQGASLASFVTIAGSSKVAAITTRYRQFVNKNTSPLPGYFEHDSYHMVIERDIHQGESWQLACALAHLLYKHNKLGRGDVSPGDRVIIATGEVDAVSANVSLISHLAQKCLHAQKQIGEWQSQHCRLSFLVPEDNYRQPLPDIGFILTPVARVSAAESILVAQGLIPQSVTIEAKGYYRDSKAAQGSRFVKATFISLLQRFPTVSRPPDKPIVNTLSNKAQLNSRSTIRIVLLMVALLTVWAGVEIFKAATQTPSIVYQYDIQTFDTCDDQQQIQSNFAYSDITQLESLYLRQLCGMQIGFEHVESPPKTIWLIADSYARVSLRQISSRDDDLSLWDIPLPTWQEESRSYVLMLFDTVLDASDEQSLEDYLSTLHSQEQPIELEALSLWSSKQDLPAQFISQTLKK